MKDIEKVRSVSREVINFLTESLPESELPVVDLIFVFGHYDPRVALQAVNLYKLGKAPKILLSGKGRDKIPHGFSTEADYYASLIEKEDIPLNDLLLEKESTNTLENVQIGIRVCNEHGFFPKAIILCAMPPLLRRSIATFKKQFPEITTYGSAFEMAGDELITESRLKRLLAEFDRFNEYASKGDIENVIVPDSVKSAVKELEYLLN